VRPLEKGLARLWNQLSSFKRLRKRPQVRSGYCADIAEAADLQEDSPAYRAFWQAAAKTPGLTEYLERTEERGSMLFEAQHKLNAELE